MAPTKSPLARLLHIVDEGDQIAQTTAGLTLKEFHGSWLVRRAVEHGLLIISEAVRTLPAELKADAPEIAWGKIEALGNFLRHEYRDIDPEVIWSITREQLPGLIKTVRRLMADQGVLVSAD